MLGNDKLDKKEDKEGGVAKKKASHTLVWMFSM
jgi:hypothetical protein